MFCIQRQPMLIRQRNCCGCRPRISVVSWNRCRCHHLVGERCWKRRWNYRTNKSFFLFWQFLANHNIRPNMLFAVARAAKAAFAHIICEFWFVPGVDALYVQICVRMCEWWMAIQVCMNYEAIILPFETALKFITAWWMAQSTCVRFERELYIRTHAFVLLNHFGCV